MSQADYYGGQTINSVNTGTTTCLITCPTPGPGQVNKILSVAAYGAGATAADINITKNDGTTSIYRIGGTGTGALGHFQFGHQDNAASAGVCGARADAVKVAVNCTGSSACSISVIHTLAEG